MAEQQKTDDFETAFAQFSAPDDGKPEDDGKPAEAAQAGTGGGDGAATGGDDGQPGDEPTATAAGDGDDTGAGDNGADGQGDPGGEEGGEAADTGAAKSGEGEGGEAPAKAEGDGGESAAKPGTEAATGPSADEILDGLRKLVGEGKQPDKAEAGEKGGEGPKEDEKPIYSEDEQTFLTEYDKEWGDVARGEALKRRAEYQQLLGYVFQQVVEFVKPIREMTEAVAERTHRQDIETNISDYSDKLRDDVIKWVETQPAYLQPAYNQVITQGTVDEVKDLVDRYRAATGKKPAGAGGQKPAGKKDNELSDEAKKAAASLAPVDVKRSGVQQPSDPSNFDDAWKQFATDET